jgi:hypothetical protein
MRYAVIATIAIAIFSTLIIGGVAAVTGPAAPTNVEAIATTETSVTLAWGPSQPGAFTNLGQPTKNSVIVGWGASQDSRSAVTYTFVKDGTTVATGLVNPQYRVSLSGKTKSFRVCVTAYNAANQASPQTCGTFTKIV